MPLQQPFGYVGTAFGGTQKKKYIGKAPAPRVESPKGMQQRQDLGQAQQRSQLSNMFRGKSGRQFQQILGQ